MDQSSSNRFGGSPGQILFVFREVLDRTRIVGLSPVTSSSRAWTGRPAYSGQLQGLRCVIQSRSHGLPIIQHLFSPAFPWTSELGWWDAAGTLDLHDEVQHIILAVPVLHPNDEIRPVAAYLRPIPKRNLQAEVVVLHIGSGHIYHRPSTISARPWPPCEALQPILAPRKVRRTHTR